LASGDHVGRHAALFHGKPGAGAARTGLHFIGDQQDAVLVAQGAQVLQQGRGRHVEAAFALHRLDDDGRHAAGFDVVLEQGFDASRWRPARSRRAVRWGSVHGRSRPGRGQNRSCRAATLPVRPNVIMVRPW
jgi:hypothetical protein